MALHFSLQKSNRHHIGPSRRRIPLLLTAFACVLFCLALTADAVLAHDPGLSSAALEIKPGGLVVELTMAQSDMDMLLGTENRGLGPSRNEDSESAPPRLLELAANAIEVWVDNKQAPVVDSSARRDEASNTLHLTASYSFAPGTRLTVRSAILARLPRGHRQYMTVEAGLGERVAERMLDAAHDSFEVEIAERAAGNASLSSGRFVALGVEHILTGYDHLAFLFALLIVGSGIRAAAKLITSFRVGWVRSSTRQRRLAHGRLSSPSVARIDPSS
jgi:HupE/UreJ protein